MYIAVMALVLFFLLGEYGSWNAILVLAVLLSLVVSALSFYMAIVMPGIWKLYRSKSPDLDEREMGVVLDAVRTSYTIFGVVSLILIFGTVLSVRYNILTLTHRGHFSLGLTIVMFLDFLIAVLPPSIIAWKERVVEK